MPAPDSILKLIDRFHEQADSYRSGAYNETQVRREFIDPMFTALGWDVANKKGYAEQYKDVVHEDSLRIGGATKAPDYCFRVGGVRKFFLEAKKPAVNIKGDMGPAFQLRRYAWSAKLPLSILTDFEELAVYDCRIKPDKSDKASKARTLYIRYDEYESKWDEIASIFARESILKGSFDRYAESNKKKRGTAEVDDAFLKEIESWRELLAKNIALRNENLSQRELNTAVQRTIDRIIFLRIAEDRGIEPYGQLQALLSGGDTYSRLKKYLHTADDRYNSGLFHFRSEKGRDEPDSWTLKLAIDDKALKTILKNLYYPDSPYEFSVLPADILGQVYEQFLGKVIRLTKGHRAIVEDKPEVKKAGGVYYTPTYIVDYIVQNTVGKLLEKLTPEQAMGKGRKKDRKHPIRILDPACGSGSFLIGAYQYLLDWFLEQYTKDSKKHLKGKEPKIAETTAQPSLRGAEGDAAISPPTDPATTYRLTTAERKRILLDHIHGVDIDAQAVETSKLSLLLKCLEGETQQTLQSQLDLFHQRALPDLAQNIKCGNSLIGSDFYKQTLLELSDDDRYRVNIFDWDNEFPQVFAGDDSGFDAVVGNPPYIRIQSLREYRAPEADFYKEQYESASKGNFDIYVLFVERACKIGNSLSQVGFICPSKFFTTDYGAGLRSFLTKNRHVAQIVDFGHEQVFTGATTYTCLLFAQGAISRNFVYIKTKPDVLRTGVDIESSELAAESLNSNPWSFRNEKEATLFAKLRNGSTPLGDLTEAMSRGVSTGCDSVFCLQVKGSRLCTRDDTPVDIETAILRSAIFATDYGRFSNSLNLENTVIFPYDVTSSGYSLIEEASLKENYPKTYEYLWNNKPLLNKRKGSRCWYAFSAPRNLHVHERGQLFVPLLAEKGSCTMAPPKMHKSCLMAGAGFSLVLSPESCNLDLRYILGVINSRSLFWILTQLSNKFRGGWITCTKQYMSQLPIRVVDLSNSNDLAGHDRMVTLVQAMLDLHTKLQMAKTQHDKTLLQRQIDATDAQIDSLVYKLYGLTDDEIRIVEEATK